MDITTIKPTVITVSGLVGAFIASFLGGWDAALQTLVIFMSIDYITGFVVASVFQKSGKSEKGALESKAGFQGLCRKGMVLLIVLVATQLDKVSGTEVIRNAVIIGYIVNETVSIIENAGLMGLPVPGALKKAIDLLKEKSDPQIGE